MQTDYFDQRNILLRLIDWAEQNDLDLPADLSAKHDDYLWNAFKCVV